MIIHFLDAFSRKFPFLFRETPVIYEKCLYIYISSLNERKFSSVWPDQVREERVEWHRMCCAGACNKNILNVMGVHCLELTRNQSNCQRATYCVYLYVALRKHRDLLIHRKPITYLQDYILDYIVKIITLIFERRAYMYAK